LICVPRAAPDPDSWPNYADRTVEVGSFSRTAVSGPAARWYMKLDRIDEPEAALRRKGRSATVPDAAC
jgi:hypothetical protein